MQPKIFKMETFAELGLKEEVLLALNDLGFETPTPIQFQSIPYLLESENDLVALAQTGTGKTAAFSLPIINQIDINNNNVQAFILSPTRELALQISKDIEAFTKHIKGLKTTAVYGGANIDTQIRKLKKGSHIVVGTPGRVCDMIRRDELDLTKVRFVVLDEADEMLSMGFKDELDFILETTPEEKQTLLFSATMPKEIAKMAKKYMKSPHEITSGERNTGAKNVEHIYYVVHSRDKYKALKRIADINPNIYSIVFCRTRRETAEVAAKLVADGYNADALHGDLSQAQRDVVMHRLRSRMLQILVATDVAARGIDVDELTHVINYSLPDQTEQYIHRSGRTGRAGRKGVSIAIISSRETRKINFLEKKVGKSFSREHIPKGREICEIRLKNLVDNLKEQQIDEENMAEFLPAIHEKLEGMTRDEIIKAFISAEFNRILAYYKNAPDLNYDDSNSKVSRKERKERKNRGESDMKRFHINLGTKDKFNPKRLMGMINDHPVIRNIRIGQIEVLNKFSFFEIDQEFERELLKSLNGEVFEGRNVVVEEVRSPKSSNRSSRKKPRKGGGSGYKKKGSFDSFKKKKRKRF